MTLFLSSNNLDRKLDIANTRFETFHIALLHFIMIALFQMKFISEFADMTCWSGNEKDHDGTIMILTL